MPILNESPSDLNHIRLPYGYPKAIPKEGFLDDLLREIDEPPKRDS
jgi:hypothetical protein